MTDEIIIRTCKLLRDIYYDWHINREDLYKKKRIIGKTIIFPKDYIYYLERLNEIYGNYDNHTIIPNIYDEAVNFIEEVIYNDLQRHHQISSNNKPTQ